MSFTVRGPSTTITIDKVTVTLWGDGYAEFYCDGDLKIPLQTLQRILWKLNEFMKDYEDSLR